MVRDFSAVILAAGYSGRMGIPKLSLRFNSKYTFVENLALEFYKAGCSKIILVVNEASKDYIDEKQLEFPVNLQIIVNEKPDLGRFYSLKKGLEVCDLSKPVCFTNVDNPFADVKIVKLLLEAQGVDYVSPTFNGKGGHPVLISQKVVSDIISEPRKNMNLKEFLNQYDRIWIEVEDSRVVLNINNPNDYDEFVKMGKK